MATARSVRISVNGASGATPSTPAWLSRSQRARPLFRNRTVSATRSSGLWLRQVAQVRHHELE